MEQQAIEAATNAFRTSLRYAPDGDLASFSHFGERAAQCCKKDSVGFFAKTADFQG